MTNRIPVTSNLRLIIFQTLAILMGTITSAISGNILLWISTALFALPLFIVLIAENRKSTKQSAPSATTQEPVDFKSYLQDLEGHLDMSVRNKMQIIPVLTEQLKAIISQTDEAAGGLSNAFMGISRQAKKQLQAVQGLFGNLAEQSSSNNILLQTQSSLQEIQTNFLTVTSFFDASIQLIGEIANQLVKVDNIAHNITNIGKTTDMLALNAAIEASRAGNTGNGFNVIAVEIKALAKESTKSIHEIQEITSNLRTKVNAIKKQQETVQLEAKSIAERTGTLFSQTTETLGATLKSTAEKIKIIADDAQGLSKEISRAVVSIQFQDITRQRIEHVISPLEALNSEVVATLDSLIKKELDKFQTTGKTSTKALMSQYTMESEREILKKFGQLE